MYDAFFLIGLVLAAGFAANWIFVRTRVSQVLILIALGFLLGPVLKVIDASNGSILFTIAPFVGSLALILLLFYGGITLNVFDLLKVLPKATLFTLLVFLLSAVGTALLALTVLNWSVLEGLLLGVVLGGTCSSIVLAMIEKTRASEDAKNVLVLESSITDALCIVSAVVLIQLIKSNVPFEAASVLNLLAAAFSIALLAGAFTGIGWLLALKKLSKKQFPYMLTLAVVFLLYGLVETVKGNGGIAIFSFGLVLGNAKRASEFFKLAGDYSLDGEITDFQDEVTFFTRTFFFVFLGLILNLAGISLVLIGFTVVLCIVFLAVRWLGQKLVLHYYTDSTLVTAMLPRGLAAAVLAGLPAVEGITINGFMETVLLVIILTNAIATAGVFLSSTNYHEIQPVPKILEIKSPPEQKTEKFVR